MTKLKVLDHGYVRLVDQMGWDLSIVRSARISYNADWRAGKDGGSDTNLINYLYSHGHNTPFESVTFTFEVKAPIFVFRQWHRHRTQSYNEVSGRYTVLPEEYYVPSSGQITAQGTVNKQGRTDEKLSDSSLIQYAICEACECAFEVYKTLLGKGCPRELARGVLPMNTYSRMFATMNLHNLFRFLSERLDSHAQYEIRVYAEAILELIKPIVPVACEAFLKGLKE